LDQKIKLKQGGTISKTEFNLKQIYRVAAAFILTVLISSLATYFIMKDGPILRSSDKVNSIYVYAPLGSKAMTILPDGTKVWLNAGSNLKYDPLLYGKRNRQVTLTGEAYFSVITNPDKPFVVNAKKIKIMALGTEFNVKAYLEENIISTTLVKGVVKVDGEDQHNRYFSIILKPSQQITLNIGKAKTNPVVSAEPEDIDARKLDELYMETLPVKMTEKPQVVNLQRRELATLLERRYNILITFDDEEIKNYHFTGIFQNETIEQVFQVLRMTAPLRYNIGKGKVSLSLDASLKLKYRKYIDTE
jgi:ferric-dicitrate binding protein FerR (iron transport regulator)